MSSSTSKDKRGFLKRLLRENKGFLLFLFGMFLVRTAIADWNPVPTGSMRPTILEGDVVLVDRIAYDLKLPLTDVSLLRVGEPARGDIVVFTSPQDGNRLIKRVMGLPGDVVEMRADRLIINGVAADYSELKIVAEPGARTALRGTERIGERIGDRVDERTHPVQFFDDVPGVRDFPPVQIPEDQYLMLGDNRNNSADSRYFGLVPRHLLKGRAHHILVSADILEWWQPRFDRMGQSL